MTRSKAWKAPDPKLRTAHDVRKLRVCDYCLRPGEDLMRVKAPAKHGDAGCYAHGYCYVKGNGMEAFAALPHEELVKLTLDEMIALGFSGHAGYQRFEKICEAARLRSSS